MKMSRKKLTNFLKTGILFFGISLLLWNCEKENQNEIIEHQASKIKGIDISSNSTIRNLLSNKLKNGNQNRGISSDFENVNLEDALLYIDSTGVKSYSVKIEKEIDIKNPFAFENLNIIERTNGDTFLFIIRYEPEIQYMKELNYVFNLQKFTGGIKVYDINYVLLSESHSSNGFDNNGRYQSRGTSCVLHFSSVPACNDTGSAYCGGSICGYISSSFEVCTTTGGGGGGGDSGSDNTNDNPWSNSGGGGSGSNGNGGTNNDGVSTVPNPPEPTATEIALSEIFDCVSDFGGLNPVLGSYLSQQSNIRSNTLAIDIQNLINSNGCSSETNSFINVGLQAEIDGAEVDWEEQIINKLTGKAKCVYDKLKGNDLMNKTIERFDGEKAPVHLILELGNITDPNVGGETDYGYTGYNITITLDNDYMNDSPSLFVALIILHEAIHADVYRKIKITSGLYLDSSTNKWVLGNGAEADFPTLFNYYDIYPENPHHNFMGDYYRNALEQGLRDYAESNGLTYSDQLYKDLSWTGLQGTNAWENMFADPVFTQNEQTRILNVINNFVNSSNNECL